MMQSALTSQDAVKVDENTHLERTASQFRQSVSGCKIIHSDVGKAFFLAEIESFRQGSPSVRLIQLKILPPSSDRIDGLSKRPCEEPRRFTFLPGQWIDTYVPHLPKPGGFSLVSTPKYFRTRGLITLSIQLTENPPSKWLWRDDAVGQKLMIRVGGNFTFPPSVQPPDLRQVDSLQFVAGGVGIKFGSTATSLTKSPLMSMLQAIGEDVSVHPAAKITFHYLVRQRNDALFLDTIAEIKQYFGNRFGGHLWITRQTDSNGDVSVNNFSVQIHKQIALAESEVGKPWGWWDQFLQMAAQDFDTYEKRAMSLAYICGPQGLTDRLVDAYEQLGMSTKSGQVQVEKWW